MQGVVRATLASRTTASVLLIDEQAEQARVLLALLVTVSMLVLRLSLKPLHRYDARLEGRLHHHS